MPGDVLGALKCKCLKNMRPEGTVDGQVNFFIIFVEGTANFCYLLQGEAVEAGTPAWSGRD